MQKESRLVVAGGWGRGGTRSYCLVAQDVNVYKATELYVSVHAKSLQSCLFVTPWTVAC